ncbi:MAG TPA: carbohydrate ABC transporter permease [Anaerolineae bacterium]|nr:carbohydrate ABC transporter permease [Anaerolineae bacterium]
MGIAYAKPSPKSSVSGTERLRRIIVGRLQDLLLLVLILIILTPILYMVIGSLKTRAEFTNSASPLLPTEWQFDNYPEMWDRINFGTFFANSFIVCGITTVIATFFAALAGYALARFRFPGADLYGLIVTGTQLIPGVLFFIPLYLMFVWIRRNLGLPLIGDNFGGIVLYVGFFTPISLWILRGFFASLPPDLEEQAMVDGATRFTAFLRISLPLAGPGIVSTAIYIFLTAWDELFFGYTIGLRTIPVGIRQFLGVATSQSRYELMSAAAVVSTLPVVIMFFVLQKRFVAGLTQGAVK